MSPPLDAVDVVDAVVLVLLLVSEDELLELDGEDEDETVVLDDESPPDLPFRA